MRPDYLIGRQEKTLYRSVYDEDDEDTKAFKNIFSSQVASTVKKISQSQTQVQNEDTVSDDSNITIEDED